MTSAETLTVTRRLSADQATRRGAARRVAAELARRGGYEAVTMAAVADGIGVARATLYRDFATKDHLLAEVMEEWTAEIAEDLRRRPPAGSSVAERVAATLDRVIERGAAAPGLTAAVLMAATSRDPAAQSAFEVAGSPLDRYLETVAGGELPNLAEIGAVLSHVLFAALITMALRGQDPEHAKAVLRTAAGLLLAPQPSP
jgi:TetR/AcrR family transcriptional regulator, cholesterol catabolism regulator